MEFSLISIDTTSMFALAGMVLVSYAGVWGIKELFKFYRGR